MGKLANKKPRLWEILNGNKQVEEDGKLTWVGKNGKSGILVDHTVVNTEAEEEVTHFKTGQMRKRITKIERGR